MNINKNEVFVCDLKITVYFQVQICTYTILKPKPTYFKICICLSAFLFVWANLRKMVFMGLSVSYKLSIYEMVIKPHNFFTSKFEAKSNKIYKDLLSVITTQITILKNQPIFNKYTKVIPKKKAAEVARIRQL